MINTYDILETIRMIQDECLDIRTTTMGISLLDCGDEPIELVNPEITMTEGEQMESEGCLSVPGKYGVCKRPAKVQVKAQDRTGKWHVYTGEELKARCFCHEIDHLDGILFVSKVIGKLEG